MSQLRLSQQPLTLTRRLLPSAAAVALVLLMALSLLLVCPVIVSQASAEGEITRETSSDFTAYVHSSVSVSLASRIDVDIIPKANAVFKAKSADLTISTNNITGYSVYLKTADETNALVDKTSTTNQATIPTIATEQTPTEFSPNTWGYHFSTTAPDDTATYSPVPLDSTATLATTETTASSDQYQLTFGTKVDSTLPAGEYSNAVTVSVVANPMTVTSLTQLTYMQDMTSDICSITPNYVDKDHYATKQLIDTRDGKSYWVAKLADGNCWMTQNLALTFKDFGDNQGIRAMTEDGKAGAVLTDGNTDLNTVSIWQGAKETETTSPSIMANPPQDGTRSWNLGTYVIATPTRNIGCNPGPNATFANCSAYGLVNVADKALWHDNFQSGEGTWDNQDFYVAVQAADPNNLNAGGSYDAHYLLGNYYQFNTVTAGSGGAAVDTTVNAPNSICAKGWKLPVYVSGIGSGGYAYLLKQYGITNKIGGDNTSDDNIQGYNALKAPLYFPFSGLISVRSVVGDTQGGLRTVAHANYTWTGTRTFPNSGSSWTTPAYYLTIIGNNGGIVNSGSWEVDRHYGYTARCLAK